MEVNLSNLTFSPPLLPPFFLGKEHLIHFPHPPECSPLTKHISKKKLLPTINAVNDASARCRERTRKTPQKHTTTTTPGYSQPTSHKTNKTHHHPNCPAIEKKIYLYFIQSFVYCLLSSQPLSKLLGVLTI